MSRNRAVPHGRGLDGRSRRRSLRVGIRSSREAQESHPVAEPEPASVFRDALSGQTSGVTDTARTP